MIKLQVHKQPSINLMISTNKKHTTRAKGIFVETPSPKFLSKMWSIWSTRHVDGTKSLSEYFFGLNYIT